MVTKDKSVKATASPTPKSVGTGSLVKLHYVGTLEDGTIFDDSRGRDPLEVNVGEKKLIKGFEAQLHGMKQGEKKKFTLLPEEAYGPKVEQLVQKVPLSAFGEKLEPKVGMMLHLKGNDGQTIGATITEVNAEDVKLDLNHPLAGKKLTFDITIESVA